jgi:hypothetical protein
MKKTLLSALSLLLFNSFSAQTGSTMAKTTSTLSPAIKYADVNNDNIVTLDEAKIVFESYQNFDDKKMKKDLAEDVESTVIELISYLEGVNCNDIKKSIASKRFIDVYYANKFFDSKDESFGLLMENLKVSSREETAAVTKQIEEEDFPETIITDRPDQTESPVLTPTGFFQVEVGSQSEYDDDKVNKINTQSTLYNTTLWKYGVTKNFELRIITEYAADKMQFKSNSDINDTVVRINGWNPIAVGSKIALHKERGIIPEIGLITHLELPYFGSDNYKPTTLIPRFRFLFAHTLSDRFSFSYNLGAEWEDGSSTSTGIYTASLGASLIGNLSMFVEAYGFLRENSAADNRLDGGFTYLLNNNVQLDCSGGIGLNDISPDYFISGGISFRFNAFNKERRNKN